MYPDGDCEIIGEKPGETWEERLRKTALFRMGGSCFECCEYEEICEDMACFVNREIQSAVEAERRRISEEAAYIESHKAFHCRFDELVKVINPKK